MVGEILGEFIEDSRDHLQSASGHLLALERNPGDRDRINGLLRNIHSIKGNAGFLDLKRLYHMLHQVENILQTVREKGCVPCPAGLIDNILKTLDLIEATLDRLEGGGDDYIPGVEELLAKINAAAEILETTPAQAAPAVDDAGPGEDDQGDRTDFSEERIDDDFFAAGHAEDSDGGDGVESFFENFFNARIGDSTENYLRARLAEFESARDGLELAGGSNARRAVKIINDFFQTVLAVDPPDSSVPLLEDLVINLRAWLDSEDEPSQTSAIIKASTKNLDPAAPALPAMVDNLVKKGLLALAVDIRDFHVLHSREIGVLVTALKKVPDQTRTGLILDPETQTGLIRVLRVMGLDRNYRLLKNETEAEAFLGG